MHRTKLVFLFLLFLLTSFAAADEWQNYFRQGNLAYQNGQYEQAIESYSRVLKAGYTSGELYFNLGNAYYKLDKMGLARLNYERALKYLKNDEALNENIKLVQLRLIDKIPVPPRFILYVWWDAVLNVFTIGLLSAITVVVFWLFLIAAALRLYYLRRGKRNRLQAPFIIALILFILFAVILIQKIQLMETEKYAIILNSPVTVFAEPRLGSVEVFVLHEGAKVKIERETKDWREIKLDDGKTGWLEAGFLENI